MSQCWVLLARPCGEFATAPGEFTACSLAAGAVVASVLLQGRHALPFQAASSTCQLHDVQELRCSFLCPACCAHRSPLVLQMGLAQ